MKNEIQNILNRTVIDIHSSSIVSDSRVAAMHFYPMSGVLRPHLNIKFVGKLERFEDDWNEVEKLYNISLPFDQSKGRHDSSSDVHGVNNAINHLFETEPSYLYAVCALLYYDYKCFDYELPKHCQALNSMDWM